MRYGGRTYCRESWRRDILAPPVEVPTEGCPADCKEYQADIWEACGSTVDEDESER